MSTYHWMSAHWQETSFSKTELTSLPVKVCIAMISRSRKEVIGSAPSLSPAFWQPIVSKGLIQLSLFDSSEVSCLGAENALESVCGREERSIVGDQSQ